MKPILFFSLFLATLYGFSQPADSSIFQRLQADGSVLITQPRTIEEAMNRSIQRNAYRKTRGFRIRIYFDNEQKARQKSFAVAQSFAAAYPAIAVYHHYEELYFRVAVGDFRTKSEAMRFLQTIKPAYPAAFIISDMVNLQTTQQEREKIKIEEEETEEIMN
jgi:hypothetical protein